MTQLNPVLCEKKAGKRLKDCINYLKRGLAGDLVVNLGRGKGVPILLEANEAVFRTFWDMHVRRIKGAEFQGCPHTIPLRQSSFARC